MKMTTLRELIILISIIGLISYAVAGPSSATGGAQPAPLDNGVVTPVRTATEVGPMFNARDSAGGASDFGQSTASTASSTGGSSQFGQSTAANAPSDSGSGASSNASSTGQTASSNRSSNGALHENINAINLREEKIQEIPDEAVETAQVSEKSEVGKKFEPSLLDQGLPEIPNSHANAKAVEKTAAINPITGATIPPRPTFSVPPVNRPPISPVPHATIPPQVPVSVGISPIPSATVSRGIDPVPSATVNFSR